MSDNTNVSISSGSTYTLDNDDTVGSLSGAGTIAVPYGMTLTSNASSNSTFSGNAYVLFSSTALLDLSILYAPCFESRSLLATPCLSNIKKGVKSTK